MLRKARRVLKRISKRLNLWLLLLAIASGLGIAAAAEEASPPPAAEAKSEAKPEAAAKEGEKPKAEEAAKEGEKKEGEPAAPVFKLANPLDGRFDLSVLRSVKHVSQFRYSLPKMTATLRYGRRQAIVSLSVVLEYGSETGMAETQANQTEIFDEVQSLLQRSDARRLTNLAGKTSLKESIALALNRRLRTAQVRQVYMTDFMLALGS